MISEHTPTRSDVTEWLTSSSHSTDSARVPKIDSKHKEYSLQNAKGTFVDIDAESIYQEVSQRINIQSDFNQKD